MERVKLLESSSTYLLEFNINEWLKEHPNIEIVDMIFKVKDYPISVLIRYKIVEEIQQYYE